MASQLPMPEKLDLEGDSMSIGLKWEKWKRSLLIYFEAADITAPSKQRATMLVLGGSALQEIFYNVPGANVDKDKDKDGNVFEIAISKLDGYFHPKQNTTYERHVFRLIQQNKGESFENFLIKLRSQAAKCRFDDPDAHIIEQILEKSLSPELRRKMLNMGNEITLDKVITEANTLDIVNHQINNYEQTDKDKNNEVNAIRNINKDNSKWKKRENEPKEEKRKCPRCGNSLHTPQGLPCPAKGKKCHRCGKLNHYQRCCRTGSIQQKHKLPLNQENEKNIYNKRQRREVNSLENKVDYIFNLNEQKENGNQ